MVPTKAKSLPRFEVLRSRILINGFEMNILRKKMIDKNIYRHIKKKKQVKQFKTTKTKKNQDNIK